MRLCIGFAVCSWTQAPWSTAIDGMYASCNCFKHWSAKLFILNGVSTVQSEWSATDTTSLVFVACYVRGTTTSVYVARASRRIVRRRMPASTHWWWRRQKPCATPTHCMRPRVYHHREPSEHGQHIMVKRCGSGFVPRLVPGRVGTVYLTALEAIKLIHLFF